MELKRVVFLCAVFFLFLSPASGQEKIPETTDEKARIDTFLAVQEKGRAIQGKVIQKRLGTDSNRLLTKRLNTRGSVGAKAEYPKVSGNPLAGRKTHLPRRSRFESDLIKQPLQTKK